MNAIQANLIQNNFQMKRPKTMFMEYGSIELGARPSVGSVLTEKVGMFIGFSMILYALDDVIQNTRRDPVKYLRVLMV